MSKVGFKIHWVYFGTITVAACSIIYELLLAQSLSTTMGNTALRYNTTIGIYIASMGLGALCVKRFIKSEDVIAFVKIETLLSIIGVLAPILSLAIDYNLNFLARYFQVDFFSNVIQYPLYVLNHLLILVIGFLSGIELPILINLGRNINEKMTNQVLASDYLGTLLGAILFPLVILPELHIFTIGYAVSIINLSVAFLFMILSGRFARKYIAGMMILIFSWSMVLINSGKINLWIINIFYYGKELT